LRIRQWLLVRSAVFCPVANQYSTSIVNANRKGSTMNRTSLVLATVLSVAAFAVQADDADPSGQYANSVAPSQVSRTQVQAQAVAAKQTGVNPWSTSYNPLATFHSERSRADVRADYLASRKAVAAMTGEDSGSAYLTAAQPAADRQFAGNLR
jgi:hypothetical protein